MFDIAIGWYRVILAYELVLHWIGLGVFSFLHSSIATGVRLVQVAQQLCFGVLDMFSMVGRVGFSGSFLAVVAFLSYIERLLPVE